MCHIAPAFFPRRPGDFWRGHVDIHSPPSPPSLGLLMFHRRAWVFIRSRARLALPGTVDAVSHVIVQLETDGELLQLKKVTSAAMGTLGEKKSAVRACVILITRSTSCLRVKWMKCFYQKNQRTVELFLYNVHTKKKKKLWFLSFVVLLVLVNTWLVLCALQLC